MSNGVIRLKSPPEARLPDGSIEAAYGRFATAIIKCAVTDYAEALDGMLNAGSRATRKHQIDKKREAEAFFRSPWFEAISDIDPDTIMSALERKAIDNALKDARKHMRKALRKRGELP